MPLSRSSTGNAGVRQTDASRTTAQTQEPFLSPQEHLVTRRHIDTAVKDCVRCGSAPVKKESVLCLREKISLFESAWKISVYILFQMVRNHDIVPFGKVGLTEVFRYRNRIK